MSALLAAQKVNGLRTLSNNLTPMKWQGGDIHIVSFADLKPGKLLWVLAPNPRQLRGTC